MVGQSGQLFVGRKQELAVLTAALDDASEGRGRLVMLAGEPGIGKTRTAQELVVQAEQRGARVLWGWCYEHRGAPPYWPWLQCIRAYVESLDGGQLSQDMAAGAADISEIVPELAAKLGGIERPQALDPEQARFRLFFSITTFLKNVSRSQPLVLVLDDLHWADESSLLLLEFLAREITASPILVVATYRDNEVGGPHPLVQTLGNLVREQHFHRVPLRGLSRNEVGEYVEARAEVSVANSAIDVLYQRTEGNPLFVGEVVGLVAPEEIARDPDWTANIPEGVREAILRRLSRLSETCNQILRTGSVIGRDFDFSLLSALNPEIGEGEFLESLDEALGIRIIESLAAAPGVYRFSHALIQQTVYEEIPPMRKAQTHAMVGDALEALHSNDWNEHAGELARHFAEAGAVGGTGKMVQYSLIAGERALETFAYQQALVHFGRVLAAKEGLEVDAEIAAALFGVGRAQSTTVPRHQLEEVHLNLGRAFDYYDSVGDAARTVAIAFEFPNPQSGEQSSRSGNRVTRALELVPDDSIEAGRLHSVHGNIQGLVNVDYSSAHDSFDRALGIARRKGNADLEMRTLNYSAQIDWHHYHFEESLKNSLMAIDLAVAASDLRSEVTARYYASMSSNHLGDSEQAKTQASAILAPAERLRDRYWLATAYFCLAISRLTYGDWGLAREANQQGLHMLPMDARLLTQRVFIEAQTGNRKESEIHLRRIEDEVLRANSLSASHSPNSLLAFAAPLAKTILGEVGRPELVEASIAAVLSSHSATPFFRVFAMLGASLLAVMNDDGALAAERYTSVKQWGGVMVRNISIDRCLGLLAETTGDWDTANEHFQAAYDSCQRAGNRPEVGWICYQHAALLQRSGSGYGAKAVSLLDECMSIATELGMTPLMDKVTELQEEMESKPARSSEYPGGLTRREVEVLRLVSAGKTDREIGEHLFISIKTVGNHVSNILNKTNTVNRAEAATYAALNGIVAGSTTD